MKERIYDRGVRLEREVVNIFKKAGYHAQRTAGSHSEFDVILWKYGESLKKICFVAFVQCKTKKIKPLGIWGVPITESILKKLKGGK